jgi:probable F420-dependent oxidoreductase
VQIGLNIPQLGDLAHVDAVLTVAPAAEAAGFSSLWAIDRLLAPVAPRSPYPGTADGHLPEEQQRVLDPLVTLTTVAAVTERIRIGTDVLVAPWYPAALLARSLATLDHLSRGRLTVGLGLGWSVDEYEAVGVPMRGRAARLEELVAFLHAWWGDDVVTAATSRERVAPSVIGLKPTQRPRPPILLATFNAAGLERVGRIADGWLPVALPFDAIAAMWGGVRESARRAGRDDAALQLVLRGEVKLTAEPIAGDRSPFSGSLAQVRGDVERARVIGATELVLDPYLCTTADDLVDTALAVVDGQLAPAAAAA